MQSPVNTSLLTNRPVTRQKNAAFSLVEIAMALGIVATGLISVLSLMPLGLSTLRNTIETAVSAQIAQAIINDVQQTDYDSLQSSQMFYFDEQGNLINGSTNSQRMYDVRLEVNKSTEIPGILGTTSNDLATLKITITQSQTRDNRTISALVARSSN